MRIGKAKKKVRNPKIFITQPLVLPEVKPAEQPIPVEWPQQEPVKIGGTNGDQGTYSLPN
jgi:hypothetical protein